MESAMESVEVKDEDLVTYIKNVLQTRILPINYTGLRELVKQAPANLKNFADSKYKEETFLNFLLSRPEVFNVSSDGTVSLVNNTTYVFPHGIDTVDAVAGISDDSYFGDREEYISDSENDSHTSVSSSDVLMFPDNAQKSANKIFLSKLKDMTDNRGSHRDCEYITTSSSESSRDYLSSATQSGVSSSGDSNSSFESCNERDNSPKGQNSACSEKTSGSSSYSSCSES